MGYFPVKSSFGISDSDGGRFISPAFEESGLGSCLRSYSTADQTFSREGWRLRYMRGWRNCIALRKSLRQVVVFRGMALRDGMEKFAGG